MAVTSSTSGIGGRELLVSRALDVALLLALCIWSDLQTCIQQTFFVRTLYSVISCESSCHFLYPPMWSPQGGSKPGTPFVAVLHGP